MRLIIAIEIGEGESYSAEAPFSESDLMKTPGKLADTFAAPMFKALLEAFEEPKAETHKERMAQLDRATKRSIEFFRQRQKAPLNS
jgi:hypothetical protein